MQFLRANKCISELCLGGWCYLNCSKYFFYYFKARTAVFIQPEEAKNVNTCVFFLKREIRGSKSESNGVIYSVWYIQGRRNKEGVIISCELFYFKIYLYFKFT